jgi:hypothetical protein
MAAYLLTGYDIARIGALAAIVDDDGPAAEFRMTAGQYAHRDLSSITAISTYTAFGTALASALNTASTGAGTYSVSWSATTGKFTITYSGGAFTLTFSTVTTAAEGTRMRQLLGFSGDTGGNPSAVSDVIPYYYLALTKAGPARYGLPFEVAGQTRRQVSVDGNAFSVRPRTREKRVKFDLMFQSFATVFEDEASASVPWTYEALLGHVGAWEPILLSYASPERTAVYKMVDPEFSEDARRSAFGDYHGGGWHLAVEGQYLGAL